LRGEADTRSVAGEGEPPRVELVERAPHPNLLPAGAEKGRSALVEPLEIRRKFISVEGIAKHRS
jgi:peptide/nickel transport system ATP-binding protein